MPPLQTYTTPQATGKNWRFIIGDQAVDLPGEVLDSTKPTAEQQARMTEQQVGGAHARLSGLRASCWGGGGGARVMGT